LAANLLARASSLLAS